MSMTFIGPSGSCEAPWFHYAMLRDNILHHVEKGSLSSQFVNVYSMAGALGGTTVTVNASGLHKELQIAVERLLHLPTSELAISARTQAVIRFDSTLPMGPPTMLMQPSMTLPWIRETSETLGDVFGRLARDLLRISAGANALDTVQVIDT